jgi:hypothetical protein
MTRDRFGLFDSYEDEDQPSKDITCGFCGAGDLWWDRASGPYSKEGQKFKLLEVDGTPHVCPPADADEFEIVE